MRWIVYSLILINLTLAAYFLYFRPVATVSVSPRVAAEAAPQLTLLREEQDAPARPAVKPGTKLCYALGPYEDDLSIRIAQARAKELTLTGIVNPVEVPLDREAEYWVHIPPLESRSEAMDTLRALQKQNVDSYIITQGDLAEGISLGLFHKEESAARLASKVGKLNFNVAIREIGKSRTEYWLEIREITRLDDKTRQRVKATDQGVDWQMIGCKHQGNR
ncbi:hypothetical protein [Thalassolituus sp.]|uniref:hypothetical protein n=1 Tax=Thalassolituus sp. TaxID=2030822 RepID=UPI003513A5F7